MGCQLVYRSQSGTQLKPDALPLVQLAEGIQHGLDALRRDRKTLAGTLRVSVPDGMVQTLARLLLGFHHEHQGVDIELVGENRMVDVAAREARQCSDDPITLNHNPITDGRLRVRGASDRQLRRARRPRLSTVRS